MEQKLGQKDRSDIAEEFKWKLNNLIESDEAWAAGIKAIGERLEGLVRFRGRLGEELEECLAEQAAIAREFTKLYVYANMKLHEDTNNTKYQGFVDTASRLHVRIMAVESFVEPEILSLEKLPKLELYEHYLHNLLRNKAHVLSAEVEEILAQVHELGEAPDNIFSMLDAADIKFGTVEDEKGNQVELTHGRFGSFLESSDREVRKNAWHTFYDSYW